MDAKQVCHHDTMTWAVNGFRECFVWCPECRAELSGPLAPGEAAIWIADYRAEQLAA